MSIPESSSSGLNLVVDPPLSSPVSSTSSLLSKPSSLPPSFSSSSSSSSSSEELYVMSSAMIYVLVFNTEHLNIFYKLANFELIQTDRSSNLIHKILCNTKSQCNLPPILVYLSPSFFRAPTSKL